MALTGNTVASTYLDLVQLEQSGAGLPSHAGAPAAIYDGGGNQVIGRTAQNDWRDPHPDAASFSETYEFSTTGDMTQGELESDGWTFANCTGEVSNGLLYIQRTGSAYWRASIDVSFAGDFDIMVSPMFDPGYSTDPLSSYYWYGMVGVADTVSDVAYAAGCRVLNGYGQWAASSGGKWTTLGATATNSSGNIYSIPRIARVWRVSGTVRMAAGQPEVALLYEDDTTADRNGFSSITAAASAVTFNRVYLTLANDTATGVACFRFLRRFQ